MGLPRKTSDAHRPKVCVDFYIQEICNSRFFWDVGLRGCFEGKSVKNGISDNYCKSSIKSRPLIQVYSIRGHTLQAITDTRKHRIDIFGILGAFKGPSVTPVKNSCSSNNTF